jgi:quercetin dioxygenase-like cupin family protein
LAKHCHLGGNDDQTSRSVASHTCDCRCNFELTTAVSPPSRSTVAYVTPEQFKWRDPTDQVATNQATLYGDPNKAGGLYIYINKFKPGRFGNPHYHPNDRFITVIDGESWHGTGAVVDTAHAHVVTKGTFMIDHANKVHWGGNKEVGGSYLIAGIGPGSSVEVPKAGGPWAGGGPYATTIMLRPDSVAGHSAFGWQTSPAIEQAGPLCGNAHIAKGLFHPPTRPPWSAVHDGALRHVVGQHRQQS